ncbi:MAG: hypothetical protein ACE15C_05400 [Phycisphaerae bacterium]
MATTARHKGDDIGAALMSGTTGTSGRRKRAGPDIGGAIMGCGESGKHGRARKLSAKEAVYAARKYFAEISGYTGNALVEEIVFDSKKGAWIVTLGYYETPQGENVYVTPPQKTYKVFEVRADTGDVMSMKVRKV